MKERVDLDEEGLKRHTNQINVWILIKTMYKKTFARQSGKFEQFDFT